MRVFCYYNLHKAVWSVKALEGSQKGRVILHAGEVTLAKCEFKVSEAGRQRVLREKKKNVHAGVVGELVGFLGDLTEAGKAARDEMGWLIGGAALTQELNWHWNNGKRVTYNPYIARQFFLPHLEKHHMHDKYVVRAFSCYLEKDRRVWAYRPVLETFANMSMPEQRSKEMLDRVTN